MTTTTSGPGVPPPPVADPAPDQAASGRTSALRWAYRLLLAAAVLAAVFVTVVPWALQRGTGRIVTITSGSMTPLYPVGGDITIDEAFEREALEPGQIITFRALSNGTVITHRIVARVKNPGMSEVHYQTKGDANDAPDPDLAPSSRIIGVAGGPVPWWEALAISGQSPKGRLLVFGSLFALVALGEMADLRRPRRRGEEAAT